MVENRGYWWMERLIKQKDSFGSYEVAEQADDFKHYEVAEQKDVVTEQRRERFLA